MKGTRKNGPALATTILLLSGASFQSSAVAQDALFTYQGKVTDNGRNFTGTGLFKFALVTSVANTGNTATATAHILDGFVTGISVTSGGSGYVTLPPVSITGGGGSGATATASVSGGSVTNISVISAGSNYTSAPTVTVAPPPSVALTTWWSNDGTSTNGSQPSNAVSQAVSNGSFTVALGNTALSNMTAIPSALFAANTSVQLFIWFNDGVNGFALLTQPQSLMPAPYAIYASGASGLLEVDSNPDGAPDVIANPTVNGVPLGLGVAISGGGATDNGGTDDTNSAAGDFATLGGGDGNTSGSVIGFFAGIYAMVGEGATTVSGGEDNTATNYADTVGGGYNNLAYGPYATVVGGEDNTATNEAATVGGGYRNLVVGSSSTVPGGLNNQAIENSTFGAGALAQALFDGSFVWADNSAGTFVSVNYNEFQVRAAGGAMLEANVQVGTGTSDYHLLSTGGGNSNGRLFGYYPGLGDGIHLGYNCFYNANWPTGGVDNAAGSTSLLTLGYGTVSFWVSRVTNSPPTTERVLANSSGVTFYGTVNGTSDRNAKRDFAPVNPSQVLDKVLALPISEWSYKEDAATRHIGPMGQDFYSIFNIGTDEKHIAPLDEEAVALAALQGLNQKVEEQQALIADLQQQIEVVEKLVINQEHN